MRPSLVAELRAGRPVFAMLEVAWTARGYAISTQRYGRGAALMNDGGPVRGLVTVDGFGEVRYGPGMKGNTLVSSRTRVKVTDVDQSLRTMLETYDPHGSAASVRWVSPYLVAADWEDVFVGIVDDWRVADDVVEIMLKTADAPLQAPGPKPIFSRAEWGDAFDASTWGTSVPLIMGIHDSYKVTGRGMVPAVNIRLNKDLGLYWWSASMGNLKTIPRIYYDGLVKELGFTVMRGTYGGVFQTIITVDYANAPFDTEGNVNGGAVVSFDCEGPAADGTTNGDALTNPVALLRAFLNNYVFRDNRSGVWLGDHAQIATAAWDAVEDYFDLYGYEGAFRLGGGEREPALKVIESFLKAHPWIKMWWTPSGTLSIGVVPHADQEPTPGDWLDATALVSASEFKTEPGDRKDILSGIISPYLYSHSEGKYLGSYEAHDLSVLPEAERVTDEIEDPFSQGRYDR